MTDKEILKAQIQQTILESDDPAEIIIECIKKNRKEEARIWFILLSLICLIFIGDKILNNKKNTTEKNIINTGRLER